LRRSAYSVPRRRDKYWDEYYRLRAGKPPQYLTKQLRPIQPPTYALSGMGNEYQPKCGDVLRLGVNGRYGSFHLWINVWVAGKTVRDLSLTRAVPERLRDD